MADEQGIGRSLGRIYQLSISRGGVPKLPIAEGDVTTLGLAGDYQRDTRNHGGADRALCLYTLEQVRRLQAEGHPIYPGSVGENVTLEGMPQGALVPGARLRLGAEVEIELTGYAGPCKTIAESFADGDFTRISDKTHPGESRVYARVLTTGRVRAGDPATLLVGAGEDAGFS